MSGYLAEFCSKSVDTYAGARWSTKSTWRSTRLFPGKVLAEDIYAGGGNLLLAKGTILSELLLGRIGELAAISHELIRLMVGDFG